MNNDPRMAELGAEQYQDELEALERIRTGMQTEDDVALIARALGFTNTKPRLIHSKGDSK